MVEFILTLLSLEGYGKKYEDDFLPNCITSFFRVMSFSQTFPLQCWENCFKLFGPQRLDSGYV